MICIGIASLLLTGCTAFYPEISMQFSEAPRTGAFDPPPPSDRHYVSMKGGTVPPKTRDGRDWDQVFGSLPDPVARLYVNDAELLKTDAETNTLSPRWESAPRGNFRIAAGDKLEIQLWDANTLSSTPIGVARVTLTPDHLALREVVFHISGGGTVTVGIEPARAIWGAGFWYELRNDSAYVSRLIESSPASRVGMRARDRILEIDGKGVDTMSLSQVRSALGSIPSAGRTLTVRHDDGGTLQVTLKEGPIYPLYADYSQLPVVP